MPIPTGTAAISFSQLRDEMNAGSGGNYPATPGTFSLNDATFRSRLTDTAQNTTLSLSSIRGNAYLRFIIAADTTNYDIRSALVAAGWNGTAKGSADVVVNSGVVVGTGSTGSYAMDTGGPWPAPSTIVVYNNGGYIVGMGGAGGKGGNATPSVSSNGTPGSAGGPGLRAQRNMTLNNYNGGIVGGGGGGGGGGAGRVIAAIPGPFPIGIQTDGGSGGGGGRTGRTPSAGGGAGTATGSNSQNGLPGNPGTFGAEGSGGTRNRLGGAGGGWGTAGVNGGSGANPAFPPGPSNPSTGGTGGAAGIAVQGWSLVTSVNGTTGISGPTAG